MTDPSTNRMSAAGYVVGAIAFVPLIGVPFGLVALIWGLASRRAGGRIVAGLGAAGLALTVALYGGLFYFGFVQRGGVYDGLREQMTQMNLDATVKEIEFYRLSHGAYPETLDQLKTDAAKGSFVAVQILDPRISRGLPHPFYYRRADAEHYYLRAVGADGEPFSQGSLGPKTPLGARIGLLAAPE